MFAICERITDCDEDVEYNFITAKVASRDGLLPADED